MVIQNEDNYTVAGWTGIPDGDSPEFYQESQLELAINVLVHPDGSVRKRFPILPAFSVVAGTGPFPAVVYAGQLIVTQGIGGNVYTFIHDAGNLFTYWVLNELTALNPMPEFNGQIIWSSVQYDGWMYFACETGVFRWQPGVPSATGPFGPPGIRKILLFRDRLFGIVGDTLFWTEPGDGLDWAAENILYVGKGDGEQLTGAQIYNDQLLLTKYSTFWALHFTDDPLFWFLNQLHPNIGCTGPRAIKVANNLVYFMDRLGMYVTDTVTFNRLHNIEEDRSAFSRPITFDIFVDTVSIYKDWVIYSSRTYGTRAYRRENPVGFTELNFGGVLWTDIREQKLFYPNNSRWLMSVDNYLQQFVPYGQGNAVPVSFQTKHYDLDRVSKVKRIKYCTVVTKGQFDANAQYFWQSNDSSLGPLPLEANTQNGVTSSCKIQGPGFGRTFSLYVSETSTKEFSIYAVNFISQLHRQQTNEHQAQ